MIAVGLCCPEITAGFVLSACDVLLRGFSRQGSSGFD